MASESGEHTGDHLAELLHRELRSARHAAIERGATEQEVTDDLTERVRRLRRLNDEGWNRSAEHTPQHSADRGDDQAGPTTGTARPTGQD
jgi:hypothetical protein